MRFFLDFKQRFLEKGLIPLEPIKDAYHKVACMDEEGYKYYLCYHGAVGDKRTKQFDKWSKNNPFKPYNMRLFAETVQENVKILSTDEELREATNKNVHFICPNCKKEYTKKWCHWIAQPVNQHFCRKCSILIGGEKRKYAYAEIEQIFCEKGFELLESKENFDCGGGHLRMHCQDNEGYEYAISLNSLNAGNSGNNKFSSTNPYAVSNLQKACADNALQLKILRQNILEKGNRKTSFSVQCRCGNIFEAEPNEILTLNRYRCRVCTKRESRLELLTREWLEEKQIPYQTQYRFPDCKYKRSLPFDFYCEWENNIILIEPDGGQHYYITQWSDEQDLAEQKIRDNIKTQYCKDHGYTLLRIPFWLYNSGNYKIKLQKTFFG